MLPECIQPACSDKPGPDGFYCPAHEPKITAVWGFKTPDGEFHPQQLVIEVPETNPPTPPTPDPPSHPGEPPLSDLDALFGGRLFPSDPSSGRDPDDDGPLVA